MAKEPDDIVLRILREIQETLADHSKEFRKVHHELTDLRETVLTAAGMAVNTSVKSNNLQSQIDSLEDRLRRVEEKIEEKA